MELKWYHEDYREYFFQCPNCKNIEITDQIEGQLADGF
jgi:hypothetical protein